MNRPSFGRPDGSRQLMLRNLATSVILYESVQTTDAKAKAVQPIIERVISMAQTNAPLTARRHLMAILTDKNAVKKVTQELLGRYEGQTSGFTRRLHLAPRLGDGAPQSLIQLTKSVRLTTKPAPASETKGVKSETAATAKEEPSSAKASDGKKASKDK